MDAHKISLLTTSLGISLCLLFITAIFLSIYEIKNQQNIIGIQLESIEQLTLENYAKCSIYQEGD